MSESVRDRAVEETAKAMYAHRVRVGDFPDGPTEWDDLPSPWQWEWEDAARDVVDALAASGLLRDALPPAIERDDSLARLLTDKHLTDQERRQLADLRERMEADHG